jgi:uncharacterized protein (TIGR03437 family)
MFMKLPAVCAVFFLVQGALSAQPIRIHGGIDNTQRVVLRGHMRPRLSAANDQGRVAPSLELPYLSLMFARTAAQTADLQQLLLAQQTPGSPDYHRWLTPEEFADRFGVSQADIDTVSAWLQAQGLKVVNVARGRTWIAFEGSAAQVESAFQIELHHYQVNGELHYANASEPSIPAAFSGVVQGIRGLSDFRMKPKLKPRDAGQYTSAAGNHYLAPDDVATIYDIAPLYAAGINGSGQSMVVAGQTVVNLSDIQQFQSKFGLPLNSPAPMLVPGSRSPGTSSSDLPEADLDLEWSGAIARQATILYVYATDVMTAVQYAIDQKLAPVVSVSYGDCEQDTPSSDLAAYQSWAQQANAQGMTWFAPAGDNGAADCYGDTNLSAAIQAGLAVDAPASVPEVTGVGGTEFNEGGGTFWNAFNSATGASAISYIPETTWNDGCDASNGCSATGGGASIHFSKPTWQTGPGVPADNARDVPDVALSASANHDGYFVFTGGSQQVYGGTSASTPQFAAIALLLNQYLMSNGTLRQPGLGNINPQLYALAASTSDVFHDVPTGSNVVTVPCSRRSINCSAQPVGYTAHAGYNQSTGWGSVDVYHLASEWNGSGAGAAPPPTAASMTLISNLTTVGPTDTMYVVATVTGANGATPAGVVSFSGNGSNLGTATLEGSGGTATATLVVTGSELQAGAGTITATYNGGATATASVNVKVLSRSVANGAPAIAAVTNGASYQQAFAPGAILTVWGSSLAPSSQTASSTPLPQTMSGVAATVNGEITPLYYVSPTLVNLQIPYEISPGSATLSLNNNGQVTTRTFTVAPAAPGIFIDANGFVIATESVNGVLTNGNSASIGQQIAIYVTGAGALSTAVADGVAPAATGIQPAAPVTVTVGGARATVNAVGLTPGAVGVMQVNFTVPSGITPGKQPVVVGCGGATSPPAFLTIQ